MREKSGLDILLAGHITMLPEVHVPTIMIAAGLMVSSLSAQTSTALYNTPTKTSPYQRVQFSVPRLTPQPEARVVCGIKMVIGDASIDPGILMMHTRDRRSTAVPDREKERSSCGGIQLVRPVRR